MESLKEKIEDRKANVGVIGLGYVGLPLAVEFAQAGFNVIGFDLVPEKVSAINAGESYIPDVSTEVLKPLVKNKSLKATTDFSLIKELDALSICVPTPLRKTKDPDISHIVSSVDAVANHMKKGLLIILESTTYPGTTEEVVVPALEKKGWKTGKDLFIAFSPERIDPGNPKYQTRNIPKIVGGITPQCTQMAVNLYKCVFDKVIPVSSTQSAEMVKLLENTFRAVNIGLVNEIAVMCNKMGLDVWEVIDGAATKPFGFMPFYPGPGLGGHCLPIDPIYLSWKARLYDFEARFIDLAAHVNAHMPHYVVEVIGKALNKHKKAVNGSKILLLGVTYKKDVNDIRESPALDIWKFLLEEKARVSYHDPYVPSVRLDHGSYSSTALNEKVLRQADCVVIVTNHSVFDYSDIVAKSALVVDTRNATKEVKKNREKIVRI